MERLEVVAAIIVRDDKILATQRGYGDMAGYWEFPGGKIESGESPEDALMREIHEELNAAIEIEREFCSVEYDYKHFHLSMTCYLCRLTSDHLELLEHNDARWLSRDELDSVPWLAADQEIIDLLKTSML